MSPKVRNLWIIAVAIALSIVIVGRSPQPVHSTSSPLSLSAASLVQDSSQEYLSQQAPAAEPSIAEALLTQVPAEELPEGDIPAAEGDLGESAPPEETPLEPLPAEAPLEEELQAPDFLDSDLESDSESESESESPELDIAVYQDPQGQFEIGSLEGFTQLSVAGSPLFESTDGAIAYTVVTQELFAEDAEPLPAPTLAAIAITTFNQGEGFQNQPSESVASEPPAIVVPWVGAHTTPQGSQPLSGKILVQQRSGTVFLVLVAANEDGRDRQDAVINTVFSSFTLL